MDSCKEANGMNFNSFKAEDLHWSNNVDDNKSKRLATACYYGQLDYVKSLLNDSAGISLGGILVDDASLLELTCSKWSLELQCEIDKGSERFSQIFHLLLNYWKKDSGVLDDTNVAMQRCLITLISMFCIAANQAETYSSHLSTFPYGKWIEKCYVTIKTVLMDLNSVDIRDKQGNSPLHILFDPQFSVWKNEKLWMLAEMLKSKGVDVNSRNCFGDSVLHRVFRKLGTSCKSVITKLTPIPSELDLNSKETNKHDMLLNTIGATYVTGMDTLLCNTATDINARNENGKTVLHLAVISGAPYQVVYWLVQQGIDINIKDDIGVVAFLNQSTYSILNKPDSGTVNNLRLHLEAGFKLSHMPRFLLDAFCDKFVNNRDLGMLRMLNVAGYRIAPSKLEVYKEMYSLSDSDPFIGKLKEMSNTPIDLFHVVLRQLRVWLKPNAVKGFDCLIAEGTLPGKLKYRLLT